MPLSSPVATVALPDLPVRRFTVEEYHRMIAAGILGEDDPLELLEGWITDKMPRNPADDATIDFLQQAVGALLPPGLRVRTQSAITTEDSEPEPDLAVVRGQARDYLDRHPGPDDIALVVEVADSSIERDRRRKWRIYARSGVACYWIVNLPDRVIEVYTDPGGPTHPNDEPGYRARRDYALGESVPVVVSGRTVGEVRLSDLFG